MKTTKATKAIQAYQENNMNIIRTVVTIDLKAIEEAGGQIEQQTMDELVISFPAVDIGNDSLVTALRHIGLNSMDIDGVLENLHCDINQRMFKRFIR